MTTTWQRVELKNGRDERRSSFPNTKPLANGKGAVPPRPPIATASACHDDPNEFERQFLPESPRYRPEDLILPPAVMTQLDDALAAVTCHSIVYGKWKLEDKNPYGGGVAINLFGEPGTGKTKAAEVIAKRLSRPFIRVKHAEIISKYPGDTCKALAAAFRAADRSGAVLIMEECEAFLGNRIHQPTSSADESINDARREMLTALDRHKIVVVFTTNRFESFDSAFLRRIRDHISFPLPDLDCRSRLWRTLVPSAMPLPKGVTPERLAEASDGLSGAEVVKVIDRAATRAAARNGVAGPVEWNDFAEFIANERAVKAAHRGAQPKVTETVITRDQLPAEAKPAFDANAGSPPMPEL